MTGPEADYRIAFELFDTDGNGMINLGVYLTCSCPLCRSHLQTNSNECWQRVELGFRAILTLIAIGLRAILELIS